MEIIKYIVLVSLMDRCCCRDADDVVDGIIVSTWQGRVQGFQANDGPYDTFLGIPYAGTTAGTNRFQSPTPPAKWKGIFVANKTVMCVQMDYDQGIPVGTEDCLVLNIYKPRVKKKGLPVAIYVHGGHLVKGSANEPNMSPKWLVEREVIIVKVNYRVGMLGFLCLGTHGAPGNAALKDVLAAVRWVHRSIEHFGGDPRSITLYGASAGGMIANIVAMSPLSKGLISKVIVESGGMLYLPPCVTDPLPNAYVVAERLGSHSRRPDELVELFRATSAYTLTVASAHFVLTDGTASFAFCVENASLTGEHILTEYPINLLKSGNYTSLPMLIGVNDKDGYFALSQVRENGLVERMRRNFSEFLPVTMQFPSAQERDLISEKVKNYYFNNRTTGDLESGLEFFTDIVVSLSMVREVRWRKHKWNTSLYMYLFTYDGDLGMVGREDQGRGATHGAELAYLFDSGVKSNKPVDNVVRDRMTAMWTNFIKTGNPTPSLTLDAPVLWLPVLNHTYNYLRIGSELQALTSPKRAVVQFWDPIYEKYEKPLPIQGTPSNTLSYLELQIVPSLIVVVVVWWVYKYLIV